MKPKVYCPYCGTEIRLADKFCGNCGKKIDWSGNESAAKEGKEESAVENATGEIGCPSCGTINKPGSERCRSCGADLRSGEKVTSGAGEAARPSKKAPASGKKEVKSSALLSGWKPVVLVVIIIVAAILVDRYTSRENIPSQGSSQQQTTVPEQPQGANMAALPQIEQMEKQVKANPENLEQTLQLANFLSDNRFYDKAIAYYQQYLKQRPKDTNARVDMGICYKEIGDYDQAMREMKQALDDDPKHLFATFNLGIVSLDKAKTYMDQGQTDKANEMVKESSDWFQKTVALAPNSEVGKRAQQLLSQHSNSQLSPTN